MMQRIFFAFAIVGLSLAYTNCDQKIEEGTVSQASVAPAGYCTDNVSAALRNPQTIDAVVQLINALPKPLDVNCLLGSLKRPLNVFAVDNNASAQPSAGQQSPRIFVIFGNLTLSVVPAGPGSQILELGLLTSQSSSIKAELHFPITANLVGHEPYSTILSPGSPTTSCAACHNSETFYPSITTGIAYTSRILRPDPFRRVSQGYLKSQAQTCNFLTEPYRCEMLKRIFIDGSARDVFFPDGPI